MVVSKKKQAGDLLTIFTEKCSVKFCHTDGKVEVLKGRWCNECRSVYSKGLGIEYLQSGATDQEGRDICEKTWQTQGVPWGSNSSCRQHIRSHFEVYEARCKEEGIIVHHHAVPPAMARRNEKVPKGQTRLDGLLEKPTQRMSEFSKAEVLKAVAEFVVCDDQVGLQVVA